MPTRTGSCLCGQVQYRLTEEPIIARICWCHDCQKVSANGTVNAIFPASAIQVTGHLSEYVCKADSGNDVTRLFCARCGTHLFAKSSARPQFAVVRVGSLHAPSSIKPRINMWASSAPSWACLDPALERAEQQPAPPQPVPRTA